MDSDLMEVPTFKVCIIGDGDVGKSTFLNRVDGKNFDPYYHKTHGVNIVPIIFQTTSGPIKLIFWDTGGHEKFQGLRDGYYIQSDAGIIMFDITSHLTWRNIDDWRKDYLRVVNTSKPIKKCTYPSHPIMVIANKNDCHVDKQFKNSKIDVDAFISAKRNIIMSGKSRGLTPDNNILGIVLQLIHVLMNDKTIQLV